MAKEIDLFRMCQLELSAGAKVKKIYGINRHELWLLMAMIATLGLLGRRAITERDLMDEISGSPLHRKKMFGYMVGLKRLKCVCVLDYNNRNTWKVLGVTELGMRIANEYERQIELLEKHRLKADKYSIEGIELKAGEVPTERYRRRPEAEN